MKKFFNMNSFFVGAIVIIVVLLVSILISAMPMFVIGLIVFNIMSFVVGNIIKKLGFIKN